ncbi:MAG: hypothetical protein E6H75_15865 [Betaproteobacteria bacterium]|nr:MAG: hypothetical protein E6H75_15865 [Betaproteobacteria bacterium]
MLVDLSGNEPLPQAREHLHRLAEEERRLVGFGKIDRRKQRRARQHVPNDEEQDGEQHLEGAQPQTAVARPIVFAAGHSL